MNHGEERITGLIKLQVELALLTQVPPVGPALAKKGVEYHEFCKAF